jgi:hypothetical protein
MEYFPEPLETGYLQDTTFLEKHTAPWPEAGTAQSEPFAESGAIGNELHSRDHGAYPHPNGGARPQVDGYYYEQVPGQSYDAQAFTTDNAGWKVNKAAPMRSSWQRSGQNLPDYQTTNWLPSVEQPYHAQLAQGPTAIVGSTPLGPSGAVPDMSQMYDGTSVAAVPPAPPPVPTSVPVVMNAYEPGSEFL